MTTKHLKEMCGEECSVKNIKGCRYADKNAPDYLAAKETHIADYGLVVFEGCVVEETHKNNHVSELWADLSSSGGINILELPVLQAVIFHAMNDDRNFHNEIVMQQKIEDAKREARRGNG